MKAKKGKEKTYYTLAEFREKFLPDVETEEVVEDLLTAKQLGITMAKDAMKNLHLKIKVDAS